MSFSKIVRGFHTTTQSWGKVRSTTPKIKIRPRCINVVCKKPNNVARPRERAVPRTTPLVSVIKVYKEGCGRQLDCPYYLLVRAKERDPYGSLKADWDFMAEERSK